MVHPITQTFRPGHAAAIASQEMREREGLKSKEALPSSKAAATLEAVSSKAFLPQTIQFIGSIALIPVAWIAERWGGVKAKTIVQAPLVAVSALETTTLDNIAHLPANIIRGFGAKAIENAEKVHVSVAAKVADGTAKIGEIAKAQAEMHTSKRMAEFTGSMADGLVKRGDAFAAQAASYAKPVTSSVSGAMDAMGKSAAKSGFAGAMNKMIAQVADWRTGLLDKSARAIGTKMEQAHAREAVGMVGRLKQVVGGAPVMASGTIAEVQPLLKMAGATNLGPAHAQSLRATIDGLGKVTADSIGAGNVARASAVVGHAEKLARMIDKKTFWESAKAGGFGAVMKGLPAALGKMPVARALILTGVVAGSAAMLLRTKAENTHSGSLLNELAADVHGVDVSQLTPAMLKGDKAPALLKQASRDFSKSVNGNWIAGAAQVAGEGLWLMPNIGMPAAMLMGTVSGSIGDIVKTDNPYLNAYAILKAEAQGHGTLKPDQKVGLVTMLVGASPSISAHGGARNKLAKPIAEQMVAEKLTVQQMVREIGAPQAMELRAVKAQAVKPVAAKVETPVAANVNVAVANDNAKATEVPTKTVGAIEPQGRVAQQALAANR